MTGPKQMGVGDRSGDETFDVVRVYVCPNRVCQSYYGSSSMGKIHEEWNRKINTQETTTRRSRCPYCGKDREERYARLIPKAEVADTRRKVSSYLKEVKPVL